MHSQLAQQAPIGVFDSGIGGLSVLRALQQRLPHERFIYVADSGNAPYGEKSHAEILLRSQTVSTFLRETQGCKALVIACNTATAAAASALRQDHPNWPIIGIEPAIKPAAMQTKSGQIGVWATRATLGSDKYKQLRERVLSASPSLYIQDVPCDGLASAVEALAHTPEHPPNKLQALVHQYILALSAATDTLVLGCTHYPLIAPLISAHLPPHTLLLDPGSRVAEQAFSVLRQSDLLAPAIRPHPELSLWSSEQAPTLGLAANHWLHTNTTPVQQLCI